MTREEDGMAGIEDMGDVNETLRSVAEQARETWDRFAEEVELERRMREMSYEVSARHRDVERA